jgi:hypothetical protein
VKKPVLIVLIATISIGINWLTLLIGWWWVTPSIGLLIGLLLRPAGVGLLASLCVGGLGWGLPLAVLALHAPVASIAGAVESVVGLSSTGGVAILVLTVALGCTLSVTGTWVGVAGRRVIG